MLSAKLKERIEPLVRAKDPGAENDPETIAFRNKMHKEADDLKIESFGVEILHTIGAFLHLQARAGSWKPIERPTGNVYIMKATSFMKSRKFLGIPGFWSRMKERGSMVKDVSCPFSCTVRYKSFTYYRVSLGYLGLGFGYGCPWYR